jgi:hypothetical protein
MALDDAPLREFEDTPEFRPMMKARRMNPGDNQKASKKIYNQQFNTPS